MSKKVIVGEFKPKEKDIELKEVSYGKEKRWFCGDIEFDGHHTLWGFEYSPFNYMKESEISGDEYRKAGRIKFFRNEKQVYERFCRTPDVAVRLIPSLLIDLQEINWDKVKEGTKIWYENQPAKIGYVMLKQGSFIIHPDGNEKFIEPVWYSEEDKYEDPTKLKIDVLSQNIWWWRD